MYLEKENMKIKILGTESLPVKGLSCFEKLKMLLEAKPKSLYEDVPIPQG